MHRQSSGQATSGTSAPPQAAAGAQACPHEWPGLDAWRAKGRDLRLRWGPAPDCTGPLELPLEEAPTLESAMASVAEALEAQGAAVPAPTGTPDSSAVRRVFDAPLSTPPLPPHQPQQPHPAPAGSASVSPRAHGQQEQEQQHQSRQHQHHHHHQHYHHHHHQQQQQQQGQQSGHGHRGEHQVWSPLPPPGSLVEAGLMVLHTPSPAAKAALTHAAWGAYLRGCLPLHPIPATSAPTTLPPTTEVPRARGAPGRRGGGAAAAAAAAMPSLSVVTAAPGMGTEQQGLQQGQIRVAEAAMGASGLQEEEGSWGEAKERLRLAALLPEHPARPQRPRLVRPKEIPGHESCPLGLNGYMLHNLAHIELNAIDLAWDTVVRFSHLDLPDQFYEDFARVADDESRHLGWCLQRLGELGHEYGDMDAHDLLWRGCRESAVDVGARLAVVPMSQEARGLDAGSRLVSRLVGAGDVRSAALVGLIAEEERAHVAVGVAWFSRLCGALGVQPGPLYRQWLLHLNPDLLKGPFNHSERARVGLPRDWYDPNAWTDTQQQQQQGQEREHGREQQGGKQQGVERGLFDGPGGWNSARQADTVGADAAEHPSAAASAASPPPLLPRRRPTRGSSHPRLQGPQPRLSPAQLRQLAERLAAFSGLEGEGATATEWPGTTTSGAVHGHDHPRAAPAPDTASAPVFARE